MKPTKTFTFLIAALLVLPTLFGSVSRVASQAVVPLPSTVPPIRTASRLYLPFLSYRFAPDQPALTCYEALVNGDFESTAGWIIRPNPVPAAYVTSPVHGGVQSMRTGIAAGAANVESYSPIEQAVTLPDANYPLVPLGATLRFWHYNVWGDGASAAATPLDLAALPRTEAALQHATLATDLFYVIAIRDDGSLDWLHVERSNAAAWQETVVDLAAYAGRRIRLQFGTYNNGSGGISRTTVDDVSLQVCPPRNALVLPAGWVDRLVGRPASNTVYATVRDRLYRSDDAGRHWVMTGTARPEHTILGGNTDTLYAGDGYACYMGGPPVPLWRTTDAGATWNELPAGLNLKPLTASPGNSRVYAAGCNGPYLSTDGGTSFAHQTGPLFGIYDVKSLAPVEPTWQEVWAGAISEGGGGAVLVTRDGGTAWSQSTPLEAELGPLGALTLDRFAGGVVYAPAYYGFFYTPDNGGHWIDNSAGLEDVTGGIRPSGLFALAQEPVAAPHALYLGTRRGLYMRDPATLVWHKVAGQPYDLLEVPELLLLDAAPATLYATTAFGVYRTDLGLRVPPTPTPTPTPAATPTPTPIPTATPGSPATPYWAGRLALPAGSRPYGIALSADGQQAYVAFHGVDHSGRTLGVINTGPLGLQAQIELAAQSSGPNGVALLEPAVPPDPPATPLVLVSNRQTANAAVVDPDTSSVVGNIPAGLLPDGLIVQGSIGYIANFGSNSVTVFDAATRQVLRTLSDVGQQPSLFAADPQTGDVYLSAYGSNQITRLHDGITVDHYDGIAAPYGLAYDPVSRRLYAGNRDGSRRVTVIDISTRQVVGTIGVGREPYVLLVNPASGHLFVACGDEVRVSDTYDWCLVTQITVPAGAEAGVAFDPHLGKVFVTSSDGDALSVIQDQGPLRVVFASNRDGNGEVYRMLPDGAAVQRLTVTGDLSEYSPVGSPDGRWIAYVRLDNGYEQVWLMSRDGRNQHPLTAGASNHIHPTWSGDATTLAFAGDPNGNWDIYSLHLADGSVTRLTTTDAADLDPDWSHLTNRIAFSSNLAGANGELYSMAADGSDVQRLTTNPNGDTQPSWAPDGQRLVFYGTRQTQTLYTMEADGSAITPLVSQLLRPAWPAWSIAGRTIVFQGYRPESGHSEIMRVDADGSGLALLTYNEVNFDYTPGWLPGW